MFFFIYIFLPVDEFAVSHGDLTNIYYNNAIYFYAMTHYSNIYSNTVTLNVWLEYVNNMKMEVLWFVTTNKQFYNKVC